MNRLPETVNTKINDLFSELLNYSDDLKMAAAEANLLGDFAQVESLNTACRRVMALESEFKTTLNNFHAKFKKRIEHKDGFHKNGSTRTRQQRGRLTVKVADKIIAEQTIADTFVKTLRVFGLERVAKLNKVVTSIPLLARTPVDTYQSQKRCDGWFITTHVNKQTATTVLEEIGKELNIPVKVEFAEVILF